LQRLRCLIQYEFVFIRDTRRAKVNDYDHAGLLHLITRADQYSDSLPFLILTFPPNARGEVLSPVSYDQ
jgi:hypothetical protein